jgi:hypothetical protein
MGRFHRVCKIGLDQENGRMGRHVLSDILEIELGIVTAYESRECNEEFGQGRVHVDIILCLEILRRKLAKMHLI